MVAAFDTNIIVDLLRKQRDAPTKILTYTEIYIPVTVVGELLFGAAISAKPTESRADVLAFLEKGKLLEQNIMVAEAYVEVRKHLQIKGKPIPENDIWIAATAHAYGLKLITRDQHFAGIDFLNVEFWK
jgi:tRNA(fMet)-specific endonuclease VapC